MAVRFYFSTQAQATPAPALAAWTEAAEVRKRLIVTRTEDGGLGIAVAGAIAGANETSMAAQWVSDPLAAGNVFSPSRTVKGVMRCLESATTANLDRQPICLKVVSGDGATLRATLLPLGHYGPSTTEWTTVGLGANRQLADGDALQANYTTVNGDRLVLEVGGQLSAAGGDVGEFGTMRVGVTADADLAENEVDNVAGTPWFEISGSLTWFTPPDDAGGCLLTILRRF